MHRNLAFPLLKRLTEVGDPIATRVFKDEVINRLLSGHDTIIEFLIQEGYLTYFNDEELLTLSEDPKYPKRLKDFMLLRRNIK